MTSSKFAIRSFREAIKDLNEGNIKGYFAVLGKLDRTVETGDPNRVYVTTFEGQTVTVINRRIPNTPGLFVLVGVDDHSANRVEIIYAINAFGDTNEGLDTITNIVPPHSHSYPEQNTTWMYDSQFIPLLVLPVAGSMTVQVYPGVIRNYGSSGWTFIDNQIVDLSGDVPGSGACWVTLQANDDGSVDYVVGSTAADRESLTDDDIPEPTTGRALVAIILEEGHTELQRNNVANDFFDLRFDILGWYDHNDIPGIDGGGDYLGTLEAYHLSLYEWEGLIKGLNADDLHIHNASAIAYDPYGCIEATNVQDAIEELETKVDNLPQAGVSWDGNINDVDTSSGSEIGEALADGDRLLGHNASNGNPVWILLSRIKTYVQSLTDTLYIAISGDVTQANLGTLTGGGSTTLHKHVSLEQWTGTGANGRVPASTTNYLGPQSEAGLQSSASQLPTGEACTITKIAFVVADAQPGDGSLVITVLKNGADTGLTLTIAAGEAAGTKTATGSVSLSSGDSWGYKLVNNATSQSGRFRGYSGTLEYDTE